MNLKEKVAKGFFWSALQQWGNQILSLVVFLLLARFLPPEAFGLVAMANVFLSFTNVFVQQGFGAAIIQREKLSSAHLDTAFWANMGIGAILSLLGLFSAGLVASFFKQVELAPVVRWLSLCLFVNAAIVVHSSVLQRELKMKPLAIRRLVSTAAGGIVGITMAVMGYGVWSLVGQQLSGAAVSVIVLWNASSWRPRLRVSKRHYKDLIAFGVSIVGGQILNFVNRRSDDLIIGYFLGPMQLGYYSVAYRVLRLVTDLLSAVSSYVTFPAFSRLQNDPPRFRKAFYTVTRYTGIVAVPAFIGIVMLAPMIVPVLFGTKWSPSIPVMQILAFIGILHTVFRYNNTAIVALGKPSWVLGIHGLNAVTNVLVFLFAVRWGIIAVAAAYVIRGYLFAPVSLWAVCRLIGLNWYAYIRQYRTPVVATLGMVFGILVLSYLSSASIPPNALVVASILLGSGIYTALISILDRTFFINVGGTVSTMLKRAAQGD